MSGCPCASRASPAATPSARIEALLDLVGIAAFAKALPHELSGGMQMRVAHRPRARDPAAPAADGRALRGARRDHPAAAQRRPAAAEGRDGLHHRLRHALRLRERLPVDAARRDDAAAGPGASPRSRSTCRRALGTRACGAIPRYLDGCAARRPRRRWQRCRSSRRARVTADAPAREVPPAGRSAAAASGRRARWRRLRCAGRRSSASTPSRLTCCRPPARPARRWSADWPILAPALAHDAAASRAGLRRRPSPAGIADGRSC